MSWEQLADVAREAAQLAAAEASAPPTVCPQCGIPLETNAAGERRCTFDGWSPT